MMAQTPEGDVWPRGCRPVRAARRARPRHLDPPFAVVDLEAFDANAARLVAPRGGQADPGGDQVGALSWLLTARPGGAGLSRRPRLTLAEALWLAERASTTSSSATRPPIARRCARWPPIPCSPSARHAHGRLRGAARPHRGGVGAQRPELRVCLDLDASLRLLGGRVHLGARRSPVHTARAGARRWPEAIASAPGLPAGRADGLRGPDRRGRRRRAGQPLRNARDPRHAEPSVRELRERRAAAVAAVRGGRPAGVRQRRRDGQRRAAPRARTRSPRSRPARGCTPQRCSTATAAFAPRPAAFFALSVVRRPAPDMATVARRRLGRLGSRRPDRLPAPVCPAGLALTALEGAGEVQTPLHRRGRRRPARRRPRVVPARQGRRAVRARQRAAPRRGRRDRRRRPDLPRRGPGLPVGASLPAHARDRTKTRMSRPARSS